MSILKFILEEYRGNSIFPFAYRLRRSIRDGIWRARENTLSKRIYYRAKELLTDYLHHFLGVSTDSQNGSYVFRYNDFVVAVTINRPYDFTGYYRWTERVVILDASLGRICQVTDTTIRDVFIDYNCDGDYSHTPVQRPCAPRYSTRMRRYSLKSLAPLFMDSGTVEFSKQLFEKVCDAKIVNAYDAMWLILNNNAKKTDGNEYHSLLKKYLEEA